jgi:hypothetical protein
MLETAKACFESQEAASVGVFEAVLSVDDERQLSDPGGVPQKYNRLAWYASKEWTQLLVVWEDDDVYLPDHLERIARAWDAAGRPAKWWGHPSTVYSDYPGHVVTEPATGRFHAAIALTVDAWRECQWIETKRADFDQMWMAALREKYGPPCDYLAGGDPTYVFRWHTGHHHGQSSMRDPADETWYERAREALRIAAKNDNQPIVPGYDESARRILAQIAELQATACG